MDNVLAYAMSFLGTPYKFGGKSVLTGLDCSGFVCEVLKSAGLMKYDEELNAQALYNKFESLGGVNRWGLGALAFFGDSVTKIEHVGFCIDQFRMIEAGGGDHLTLTVQDAMPHNACVRIRPILYRHDFRLVIKPSYAPIGIP